MLAFLSAYGSFAQMNNGLFGNEWINYQQSYYKMKVTTDGIHRITRQALQQSGVDLNNLNATNIQVYHQGNEVAAHVQMNGTTLEYIEFYGQKNRGSIDNNLYKNPNHHFNPEYSVITDTATYFLSWSNANNGRRYVSTTTNLSNPPAKENYYWQRNVVLPTLSWQAGKAHTVFGDQLFKSSFEFGEGWGASRTNNQSIQVATPNVYNAGPAAIGKARMYSSNLVTHNLQIKVNSTPLHNGTFFGDSVGTHSFNVPLNLLNTSNTINIVGQAGANDMHALSYVELLYPHNFDFEGKSSYFFKIEASNTRKFLEINNFSNPTGTQNIYLYDITNGLRIHCFWDGNNVLTDLPASSTARELVLINLDNSSAYTIIGRVEPVQFTNYAPINGNYIIIAHSNMFSDGQGNNPVLEYAAYRSSTGFNPVVVNVQEVFDQFGYGINMHPQALRNFAAFVKQNWTAPEYIFLIGKGRIYNKTRNFNTYDHLIPTFGSPPSDNMLLEQGGSNVALIPVGRLAITNGSQLATYLQKIKDVEALQNGPQTVAAKAWMKNIIHMSSGVNSSEINAFKSVLNSMKLLIDGANYGANVSAFSNKPDEVSPTGTVGRLDTLINTGVSMMTYLGHSTEGSFDYDIYNIEKYKNYQKYPLFLSLSCSNGNIFEDHRMMSEDFVLSANSGSAAFIAFVAPISLSAANQFSIEFYRQLAQEGYGKGTGHLAKAAVQSLDNLAQYSILAEMAAQYLSFHGDPAFRIQSGEGADYTVDPASIHTVPAVITAEMESFNLVFDLYNLGKVVDTSFQIALYRKMPNGDSILVTSRSIKAPLNVDNISLKVPVGGIPAVGLNNFFIQIDLNNTVAELPNPTAEDNNLTAYALQIIQTEVKPIFPPEFAMVPTRDVKLLASTGNAFAPTETYAFEIDTTMAFDSPLLTTTEITQSGGVLSWEPNLNYLDSTVYYWRVRSLVSELATWSSSSFMYKAGETGWNQSHVFQFKKNDFHSVELDEVRREFSYVNTFKEISVTNAYTPSILAAGYVATFENGLLSEKCRCQNERGVYVQVVDPTTFNHWIMPGGSTLYGAINCDPSNRDAKVFLFETDKNSGMLALENFLRDSIPSNFYVMLHSLNNANAINWPNSLLSLLENKGSSQVRDLATRTNGSPWAFFYQNGNPTYANTAEKLAASENDIINLSGLMSDSWYKGSISSTIIGPAKGWDFMDWVQYNFDGSTTDKGTIDVFGLNNEGVATKIFNNVLASDTSLAVIDALQYPFLQLVWNNSDSINKTAPQLDFWRISGEFMPELALRADLFKLGHQDSIRVGRNFNLSVMLQNISEVDMDSILIKYQLVGTDKTYYQRVAGLIAGDTMRSPVFSLSTANMIGNQQILIEINPDNDQPEMYHFNNFALVDFHVFKNERNSTDPSFVRQQSPDAKMTVLFDNKSIQNGEIVSATPQINVDIKINRPIQEINNINDLEIRLDHPNLNGSVLLDAKHEYVQSISFETSNAIDLNHAKVKLNLDLPWEGAYSFSIYSKNVVELTKYETVFQVEFDNNPVLVAQNYPNPFKSHTRFMFTIEENILPETVKIQITDLAGSVLRELSNKELGTLSVGENHPSFAWDATDQSGIALPAGTYFYNIYAQDSDGNNKRIAAAGKMLLIN